MTIGRYRNYQQEKFKLIFENSPIAIWEEDFSILLKLKKYLMSRKVVNIHQYLTRNPDVVKRTFRGIKVLDVNRAALKLYGVETKQQLVANFGKVIRPEMVNVLISEFTDLLEGKRYFEAEFKTLTSKGKRYDVLLKVSIPKEYQDSFSRAIVTIQDISDQKKLERHLRKVAQLDSLTQLYNHHTIVERLEAEVLRSKRYGSSLSCMMIDVDHFKIINDKYGHQKGDTVIKRVAQTFRRSLRQVDIVGRYGGDEFFIILPETKASNAKIAAQRLQTIFASKEFFIRSHVSVKMALSIGICGYPDEDIKEVKDLIAKADQALYTAKHEGRNRIVVL